MSDPEAVEAAAEKIEEEFGPIDIWGNDAMMTVFAPFKEISADEFRRATEITYLGCRLRDDVGAQAHAPER